MLLFLITKKLWGCKSKNGCEESGLTIVKFHAKSIEFGLGFQYCKLLKAAKKCSFFIRDFIDCAISDNNWNADTTDY